MSSWNILFTIISGLVINEYCEVSPWAARLLVRWSAYLYYSDAARAEDRAEELAALIDARPGKLFKLCTALGFVAGAVTTAACRAAKRRIISAERHSSELAAAEGGAGVCLEGLTSVHIAALELVRNFFGVASPPAFRLATLLAAAPITTFPVARVVQAECVPEAGPEHLTEVFASGLLHPVDSLRGHRTWDHGTFEFRDSIREALLSGARRSEVCHVVRVVTTYFGVVDDQLDDNKDADIFIPATRAPDLFPKNDLVRLRDWLVGITVPQLSTLVSQVVGSGAPSPPPAADAWDVFLLLTNFCARPNGVPPALLFLKLLARQVGDKRGADLMAWNEAQARRLHVKL